MCAETPPEAGNHPKRVFKKLFETRILLLNCTVNLCYKWFCRSDLLITMVLTGQFLKFLLSISCNFFCAWDFYFCGSWKSLESRRWNPQPYSPLSAGARKRQVPTARVSVNSHYGQHMSVFCLCWVLGSAKPIKQVLIDIGWYFNPLRYLDPIGYLTSLMPFDLAQLALRSRFLKPLTDEQSLRNADSHARKRSLFLVCFRSLPRKVSDSLLGPQKLDCLTQQKMKNLIGIIPKACAPLSQYLTAHGRLLRRDCLSPIQKHK